MPLCIWPKRLSDNKVIDIPAEFILNDKHSPFPNVELALKEPNGLIAIGGELSTERLLLAYQSGIFPWYSQGEPVIWYSPDPRLVMTQDRLHISKSLSKTLKSAGFEVRVDEDFSAVIYQCQNIRRKDQDGTWIDNDMLSAYTQLHQQGYARSVEVYQDQQLVGGLYGVSLGKVFFGESMFARARDASKVALVHLVQNMGYQLIDCQVESPHLKSLGAYNIRRSAFIKTLEELL